MSSYEHYIYNIHVNKTDRHEITEILLKVALNTILPIYKVEVLVYFSSQWRDDHGLSSHFQDYIQSQISLLSFCELYLHFLCICLHLLY
jgi:hypothetical protein